MMFLQTCLWLLVFHASKCHMSWVTLMDSEQNYIPPPVSTTSSENGPSQTDANQEAMSLDTTCPILYPRYPHVFGLTQNQQGFHLKCKRRTIDEQITLQSEEKDVNKEPFDIPKYSHETPTEQEDLQSSHNIKNAQQTQASESHIPQAGDDNTEDVITSQTDVPKTESNLQDIVPTQKDEIIDKTAQADNEIEKPYIVKAIPTDKAVLKNIIDNNFPSKQHLEESEMPKKSPETSDENLSSNLLKEPSSPTAKLQDEWILKPEQTTTQVENQEKEVEGSDEGKPSSDPSSQEKQDDSKQPVSSKPREKNDTEHEEFVSFQEWSKRALQEEENKREEDRRKKEEEKERKKQMEQQQHNMYTTGTHGTYNQQRKIEEMKKNFASVDCAAKVFSANIESENSGKIISISKDEYMLNKCIDKGWFIVELCESIKAHKIEMANFELFSSVFKSFRVSLANTSPGKDKDWAVFGEFEADDVRDLQTFTNELGVFGKFVKVEIFSHYGNEHYCPISLFKIYGISEIQLIGEDDDDDDHEAGAGPEGSHQISNDQEVKQPLDNSNNNNIVNVIQRKVGETIDVLKGVFTPEDQIRDSSMESLNEDDNINASSLIGTTFKYDIICPGCDEECFLETRLLVSEDFNDLLQTLANPSLRFALTNQICSSYGFNLKSSLQATCMGYRLVEFFKTLFGTSRMIALCNVIAWQEGILKEISATAKPTEGAAIAKPERPMSEQVPEHNIDTSLNVEAVKSTKPYVTSTQTQNLSPSIQISVPNGYTGGVISSDHKTQSVGSTDDQTIIKTHDVISGSDKSNASGKESIVPTPVTKNVADSYTVHIGSKQPTQGQTNENDRKEPNEPPRVVHVPPSDSSQLHEATDDSPLTDSTTQKPNQLSSNGGIIGGPPQVQRESVWLKLSNRIKNLERNVTMSGAYLEELSVRYKKQIEDLQLAVKKSNEALNVASKFRQQERITVNVLQAEVANLTEQVANLTIYMEAISVGAVYAHAFFLILEISIGFLFIFACCRRLKSTTQDKRQLMQSVPEVNDRDWRIKAEDSDASFCQDGVMVGQQNGMYVQQKRQTRSSETDKDTDISSTPSSSPIKRKKRRHSFEEDLFAIYEEQGQGEIAHNVIANGGPSHLPNRRNSMVVLSEPPPLSRKQRRRLQRKQQAQLLQQQPNNRHVMYTTPPRNILSENRVQDLEYNSTHENLKTTPAFATSPPHYHTIHSPPKDNSPGQLPWTQVTRAGSMDNLSPGGTKTYGGLQPRGTAAAMHRAEGMNHYVQSEQNSRFVVQPVVNVYLNSQLADPLKTSNKYGLLNNSLHDDPTPIKERSLNYGLETSCEVTTTNASSHQQNGPLNKQRSKHNPRKKQLFSDSSTTGYFDSSEERDNLMSTSTGSMIWKPQQPSSKVKRSKSTSPKRVGRTAKQRVLFKNFNPDNAEWIQKH